MHIAISGGHLTPALAVIDYAKTHYQNDQFVFFGRLYSQPSLKQRSWEESEITRRKVSFVPFDGPKLDSQPIWRSPLLLFQMLQATWNAYRLLGRYHPDLFLSFGGYLAVPLALAAKLRGIPIVTHEQTRVVGVANSWVGKLAQAVAISFPESKKYFSASKIVLTGNPLRAELLEKNPEQPTWAPKHLPEKPLLYVTGGNQGSQFINLLVQECLPQILEEWWVIHQCGSPTTLMNYQRSLEKARQQLPQTLQAHYVIREWVTEQELCWIYTKSAGVLSRSGANTVTELMTVGLPAVFIPLPQAHQDEQRLNAEAMADHQAALILLQKDASATTLIQTLKVLRKKLRSLTRQAQLLRDDLPPNPTAHLYQLLQQTSKK